MSDAVVAPVSLCTLEPTCPRVHSLRITSVDMFLRDGPEIDVSTEVIRGDPLVSAEEGVNAFAAAWVDPNKVDVQHV